MSSTDNTISCDRKRALIQWQDGVEKSSCYLGTVEDDLRMTICLGTPSKPELLIWFNLLVGVRSGSGAKIRRKSLAFVVEAEMFDYNRVPCLSSQRLRDSYHDSITGAAIHDAGLGLDDTICCLHFRLGTFGKVFMPKPEPESKYNPASTKSADVLAGLKSLSQTNNFHVFISLEEAPLRKFCERVSEGAMKKYRSNFKTQTAFIPSMICDAWENFDFNVTKEKPMTGISSFAADEDLSDPSPVYYSSESGLSRENEAVVREVAHSYPQKLGEASNDKRSAVINQEEIETESEDLDVQNDKLALTNKKRKFSDISSQPSSSMKAKSVASSSNTHHPSKIVHFGPTTKLVQVQLLDDFKRFMRWMDEIDPNLENEYQKVFSGMGEAIQKEDMKMFSKIKYNCKAEIYCNYEYVGGAWQPRRMAPWNKHLRP